MSDTTYQTEYRAFAEAIAKRFDLASLPVDEMARVLLPVQLGVWVTSIDQLADILYRLFGDENWHDPIDASSDFCWPSFQLVFDSDQASFEDRDAVANVTDRDPADRSRVWYVE